MNVEECAKKLEAIFSSDQGYFPSEESLPIITAALKLEKELPSEVQMVALVMGGEDGEIPEELMKLFPNVNSALHFLVVGELLNGHPNWEMVGKVDPLPKVTYEL